VAHLQVLGSSSPRDDLKNDPLASNCKPINKSGFVRVSLQQYAGTNIVQWHGMYKGGFQWHPVGPVMQVVEDR